MNNKRRKQIRIQILELSMLNYTNEEDLMDELETIKSELEWIRDEEQDAFDNIPENLQCSYNASLMEDNIEYLDNAISVLEEVINQIGDELNITDLCDSIKEALNILEGIH